MNAPGPEAPGPETGGWRPTDASPPRALLVPLDGSSFGESALRHAVALARMFDASVHLVRVLDPELMGGTSETSAECRVQRAEAEGYLRRVAERLDGSGIETAITVREGNPPGEIVRCAEEREVELIVMAARPRLEGEHLWSRDVAQRVVAAGVASVLLARGEGGLRTVRRSEDTPYHSLVVALDGSRASHRALGLAVAIGRSAGAGLVLLHVCPKLEAGSRARSDDESDVAAPALTRPEGPPHADYIRSMERSVAREGVAVKTRLIPSSSEPPNVLERVAVSEEADLLVLGAHGAGEASGPYGGCARHLLIHGRTPVLVVQDRPADATEAKEATARSHPRRPDLLRGAPRPPLTPRSGPPGR